MVFFWLLKCGFCLYNIRGRINKVYREFVFYLFFYVKGGKKEELVLLFIYFLLVS